LIVALATGMYLVNRKAGLFLYIYAFLCIGLPRLYLGIHYPSDLLAGALFGWAIAYSANWVALRSLVAHAAQRLSYGSSGLFYACFFFLTFQTAYMYDPLRAGAHVAVDILRIWLHLHH
jgi:undecaprenyl-diphosphatase